MQPTTMRSTGVSKPLPAAWDMIRNASRPMAAQASQICQGWRQGTGITVQWKNLFWSVLSLAFFALTLKPLGVVVSTFLTCLLALVPSTMTLRTRLTVCAVVSVITVLIFPIALQMILPIWPWSL